MIINTTEKFEVGIIINGWLSDGEGKYHPVIFRIMREATEQEYLNFCKSQGVVPLNALKPNFYEVSVY